MPSLSVFWVISAAFSLQEEVEKTISRLKTDSAAERRRVMEEICKQGVQAIPAALRVLENAQAGIPEQVASWVRQLSSRNWKEREEASRSLVRLGRFAKPALMEHENAADPEVAWRVRAVMAEITEKAGRDEQLDDVRNAALCEFLGEAGDVSCVKPLLKLLATGNPPVRLRAAEALGKLRRHMEPAPAEEAAEKILEMLGNARLPAHRTLLLRALGRLKAAAGVRPLAALLTDRSEKNLFVKQACMAALVEGGDERGFRAVIETLASDDVYLRQSAAALLTEATGQAFGYDPCAAENREAIAKFKGWWGKKHGKEWGE